MSDQIPEVSQGLEGLEPPNAEEYVPNDTPVQSEDGSTDTGNGNESESGINPNWKPLLEQIPTEFHQFLTPEFKKWDDNFNQVQSRYSPYKQLAENNVPYDLIQNSLQLSQALNADPRGVYDELEKRYGFSNSGQGQQENAEEENEEENPYDLEEGKYDPLKDPRMQPYFEQQRLITEGLMQQQQAQLDKQAEQEINRTWAQLDKANGRPLSEEEKTEVLNRTILIADRKSAQTGKEVEPNLIEGFKDYTAFVNKIRANRANNSAPDVLGGSGGLPAQPKGIHSGMTDDQRQEYIEQQLELLNKNQQ